MNAQDYLWETSKELARDSFKKYIENPHRRLYLYGQKDQDGTFTVFEIAEDSVREVIINESIPRNMTIEALQSWFTAHLKSAPIIPRQAKPKASTVKEQDDLYFKRYGRS